MKFEVTCDNRLEFMKRFIISRYDTFAIQTKDGRYRKVEKPLTDAVLNRHLERKITIGCYNSTPDSRCKFALIDVDAHEGKNILPAPIVDAKVRRITATLREFGIPHTRAESSPGNYHIYFFFHPYPKTSQAYDYVRWILRGADLPNEECFPKQRRIPDGEYGNLLRLCFSEHKGKHQLYHFIDDEKNHIDEFEVETIDISGFNPPHDQMKPTTEALKDDETIRMNLTPAPSGGIPPCLSSALENNLQLVGGGGHYARIAIVCAYRDAGLPFAALCRLFTGQEDYEQVETAKQVNSVLKKVGGYSYSCRTLRDKCFRFIDCQNCCRGGRFK